MNLMELVRKRHDGPAWILVEECGNGTGYHVKRHADAVAVGVWPSRGYEIHGYELKQSRGDVQKELDDPSKADAVGKYCDYWWLVVSDLAIIDGLVIPDTWGILAPKHRVLRAHRKAPKRDATPVNRSFVAALVRRVTAEWVPKHLVDEIKKNALAEATAELERQQKWKKTDVEYERDALQRKLADFERDSGLSLEKQWENGDIARAVKAVIEARTASGQRYRGSHEEPAQMVRAELGRLERDVARHDQAAAGMKAAIERVRALLAEMEPDQPTSSPQEEPCVLTI